MASFSVEKKAADERAKQRGARAQEVCYALSWDVSAFAGNDLFVIMEKRFFMRLEVYNVTVRCRRF